MEARPTAPFESESEMNSAVMERQPETKPAVQIPELSDKLERDLVQVFKLLADETRLKILMYLVREGELHVSALCERLNQSQPAVSHHLALLRVAGLIEPRRDGKHNFYSVQKNKFHEIVAALFTNFSAEGQTVRFEDFTLSQQN
jgi:ArsR family transcriptional regulator